MAGAWRERGRAESERPADRAHRNETCGWPVRGRACGVEHCYGITPPDARTSGLTRGDGVTREGAQELGNRCEFEAHRKASGVGGSRAVIVLIERSELTFEARQRRAWPNEESRRLDSFNVVNPANRGRASFSRLNGAASRAGGFCRAQSC